MGLFKKSKPQTQLLEPPQFNRGDIVEHVLSSQSMIVLYIFDKDDKQSNYSYNCRFFYDGHYYYE